MKKYIISIAVLLIGIGIMAYTGTELVKAQQIYSEGNMIYDNLRNQIRDADFNYSWIDENIQHDEYGRYSEYGQSDSAIGSYNAPRIYVPFLDIDFDLLEKVNPDSAAWLYSPNTAIDYPVMRASDYNYYLKHLPDGTRNANGSLFIDYNNSPLFDDRLTVIYGHHMKSGSMFGSLVGYKKHSYYEQNPYMYLYTENGNYRIDLLYGFVVDAGGWSERAFMFEENVDELLAYAKANTTFVSNAAYEDGDQIIALSTCSYEFDDARYVVLGILQSEY